MSYKSAIFQLPPPSVKKLEMGLKTALFLMFTLLFLGIRYTSENCSTEIKIPTKTILSLKTGKIASSAILIDLMTSFDIKSNADDFIVKTLVCLIKSNANNIPDYNIIPVHKQNNTNSQTKT